MNALFDIVGNGTNSVIAACKRHGAAPPKFEELQGFLIVTFKAQMIAGGETEVAGAQSEAQSIRVLDVLSRDALSARALAEALGLRSKTGALKRTLNELLGEGLIEYTLPDKPNSRLQKYRLTNKGRSLITKQAKEAGTDEE